MEPILNSNISTLEIYALINLKFIKRYSKEKKTRSPSLVFPIRFD